MRGFAYGADDFDAGLSEAIDRARTLLRNIYAGGMSTSRPAHSDAWSRAVRRTGARPVRRARPRPVRRTASRAGRGRRPGHDEDCRTRGRTAPDPARGSARGTTRTTRTAAPATRGNTGITRHGITSTPSRDLTTMRGLAARKTPAPGAARGAAVSPGRTGPRSSAARARAGGRAAAGVAAPDGPADRGRRARWAGRPRRAGWAAAAEGVPGRRARHDSCAAHRGTADGLPDHVRHRGAQPGGAGGRARARSTRLCSCWPTRA